MQRQQPGRQPLAWQRVRVLESPRGPEQPPQRQSPQPLDRERWSWQAQQPGLERRQVQPQSRRGWKQEPQQAPAVASSQRARWPGREHRRATGWSQPPSRRASGLPACHRQQDGAPAASPGGQGRRPSASDGRPSSRQTETPARTRWRKDWRPGFRRQRRKGSWREGRARSLPEVRKYRGCCSLGLTFVRKTSYRVEWIALGFRKVEPSIPARCHSPAASRFNFRLKLILVAGATRSMKRMPLR